MHVAGGVFGMDVVAEMEDVAVLVLADEVVG
jgi:hypothetical protein